MTKSDTKLLKSSSFFRTLEGDVANHVKTETDRYTIDGAFHMTSVVDKGEKDIIDMTDGFDFSRTPDSNFAMSMLSKSPRLAIMHGWPDGKKTQVTGSNKKSMKDWCEIMPSHKVLEPEDFS